MGEKDALFTDNKFHNIGVGADYEGTYSDPGRYNVTHNEADKGAFKDADAAPHRQDCTLHA